MTTLDKPTSPGPVAAVPRMTAFAARQVAPAESLCERLRQVGIAGAGLFTRRTQAGTDVSLVAARCLLRVELRGERLVVTALEPAAGPLLPLLASRLGAGFEVRELAEGHLHATVPDERARVGTPDDEVLRAPSCLDALRTIVALVTDARPGAPLPTGLLGAFGYELVDRWEDLGPRRPDPLDEPDYSFVLVGDAVVYDGEGARVTAIVRGLPWERASLVAAREQRLLAMLCDLGEEEAARPVQRVVSPAAYEPDFGRAVGTLLHHIGLGDVYQAVLSRAVALPSAASPAHVLRALGADAPWRFRIDVGNGELIGASPETCLSVDNGEIELRPLAGTVPRGFAADGTIDPDLDRRLGVQLLLDDKEQAEHAMLVDLARNDVARVCAPGTMRLVEAFELLHMPRVQHLASRVRGRLREGYDALHAYRAVANMGTLTGAPKPMAMQLVRQLERTARGFYGGAIAFLGSDGTLRSCIAIRMLRAVNGTAVYHARAGAGIVHDSTPEAEFWETEHKLSQLRQAVAAVTP